MNRIIKKVESYLETQKELSGDEQMYRDLNKIELNINEHNTITESTDTGQRSLINIDNAVGEDWVNSTSLETLNAKINKCLNCKLGNTRTKFVFGTGNPNAEIMFIGEAPGADEDMQGKPFVGRAGQLLTKIIESIGWNRNEVYIANIIKCRPPQNRRPEADEVEKCRPYLEKQIDLIKPKFIVALGLTAVDSLFSARHKMANVRGKIKSYKGTNVMITYHPAALLRNPNFKRPVWEDMKLLKRMYEAYGEE